MLRVAAILLLTGFPIASSVARTEAPSDVPASSEKLVFRRTKELSRRALAATFEKLSLEHLQVLDQLNQKDSGAKVLELDDSRVPALLRKGWNLAGVWAAEYLETHPRPSTRDLKAIFTDFAPKPRGVKSKYGDFLEYSDYSFIGSAVRVGPSTFVVIASYGVDFRTGTFMVVARNRDGHFQALWDIKDLAEKHYAQRDEIGRWMHLVRRAYYNGPLDVEKVLRLSPSSGGQSRFLVDAYQGADGGTALGQLSIWEWNGAQAKPLLVEVYYDTFDSRRFRLDGRMLRISTKEELDVMYSCGTCTLPKGIWTVRITSSGIQNLGHRFLQPEIRWADELLSAVSRGKNATNSADGKVLDFLQHLMQRTAEGESASHASEKLEFNFGMLEQVHIVHRGHRGRVVLVFDDGPLRFRYVLRRGRPYFTGVSR